MSDKLNFDTLDILAAAIGAIIAFSFLPVPGDRNTERVVVGLAVFLSVAVKRKLVPTLSPNPESKLTVRLLFLLTSLIGTCVLVLILIDNVFAIAVFYESTQERLAVIVGMALLIFATIIDRRYLKVR